MKKENREDNNQMSAGRKKVFWIILALIPLLFFIVFEIFLQVIDYGGNQNLFIEGPKGFEKFLQLNPSVAERYFYNEATVPTPPIQLMYREKPENCQRIFVFGGSSAAGFPYTNNVSFPSALQRMLTAAWPGKEFEVINISMSAINSYTWLDLVDEALEMSPDVILLYAGHNEYYGALGVGSVQTLGNSGWIIRAYLNLQSVRIIRLLRDVIGWGKGLIAGAVGGDSEETGTETLMTRIVSETSIPYKSELYEAGKEQFDENLKLFIQRIKDEGITLIPGTLVSNLSGQKPFESPEEEGCESAAACFEKAIAVEDSGDYKKAKEYYIKAKDLDGLRFRAPSEFNDIIRSAVIHNSLPLAEVEEIFENNSQNGIPGNDLLLEHLHPNIEGYQLIAEAYFNALAKIYDKNLGRRAENWSQSTKIASISGITDLDSVYASIVIRRLKSGWPFQPKEKPNRFFDFFKPVGELEELSLKILTTTNFNLEAAHMELGKKYENEGKLSEAFKEYFSLIASIPHEPEFYESAARVALKMKNDDVAMRLLESSLKYKASWYAVKWVGLLALKKKDYKTAIAYLRNADQKDEQVLFNLSRAYYSTGDNEKGEEKYNQLISFFPNTKYRKALERIKKRALTRKGH